MNIVAWSEQRLKFRWTYLWIALLLLLVLLKWKNFQPENVVNSLQQALNRKPPVNVMLVGSSVAEGWDDPSGGGYLKRAFSALGQYQQVNYHLESVAKAGDTVVKVAKKYPQWLKTQKPQVVVLSWGVLDDLSQNTNPAAYKAGIKKEIEQAIAVHAQVFIVTPPVTRASYTQFQTQEAQYVNIELQVAKAFAHKDVNVFDVYNQMKAYLTDHHQTYKPYMADGWHPNTKGHELAGQLLLQDMKSAFGTAKI